MTADPKLVEAVARALYAHSGEDGIQGVPWDEAVAICKSAYLALAECALSAINASGEWWVAPVEATDEIIEAYAEYEPEEFRKAAVENRRKWLEFCDKHPGQERSKYDKPAASIAQTFPGVWGAMRTAYLAKTEETAK